jgi:nucleoid-associated protein YgaU
MRYQFTPTEKRYDGKLVFKTTYYPNIPETEDDIYITASNEDYLDALAKKYYGDEMYWWIIALVNNISDGICPLMQINN